MEIRNPSTPISIPTTDLVMGFADQTDILIEFPVITKLDILKDITKLVRGELHFIPHRGEQVFVSYMETDLNVVQKLT